MFLVFGRQNSQSSMCCLTAPLIIVFPWMPPDYMGPYVDKFRLQ